MYDTLPIQNGLICQSQRMIGTFLGGGLEHVKPCGSDAFWLLFIFFEWVGDQPPTRLPNEACFCCWGSLWSCRTAASQRIDDLHDQWSRASDGKHKMTVLWPIHGVCIYVYIYLYIYMLYHFWCVYSIHIQMIQYVYIYIYTYPVLANIEIGKDSKAWQIFWILNELALYQCWARLACGFPSYLIELPCKRDDHEWVGYAWSTVYPANMLGPWSKPSNLCGTCPMLY